MNLVLTAEYNNNVDVNTVHNSDIPPPSNTYWLGYWDTNNWTNFFAVPSAINLNPVKGAITAYTNLELNGGTLYSDIFDHDKCNDATCSDAGWVYIYIKSESGKIRVDYSTDSLGTGGFLESSTSLWNLTGTHRIQFDWRKAPNQTRLSIDNVVEDSKSDTVYFINNGIVADFDTIPSGYCGIGVAGGATTGLEKLRIDDVRIYGVNNP